MRCKGTTNIWNIQGFFAKSQIYLKFCRKALLFAQLCERSFEVGRLSRVGVLEVTTNILFFSFSTACLVRFLLAVTAASPPFVTLILSFSHSLISSFASFHHSHHFFLFICTYQKFVVILQRKMIASSHRLR